MQRNLKSKSFKEKVIFLVKKIPSGKTKTYKQIAIAAGNPHASRAVGMIMSKNQDLEVPCHRVIRSDGGLAGYNGLRGDKRALLIKEGALKL